MKRSEELKLDLKVLEAEQELVRERYIEERGLKDDSNMGWWAGYYRNGGAAYYDKEDKLKNEIRKEQNREIEVGDGVTLKLWTDRYACTVIRKTKKTITIQRDKAVLSPDFKPEWIAGGFAAHCTNTHRQSYTYERDESGEVYVCHWSEKEGRYRCGTDGSMKVYLGRHEYYDYNF